jgi:hypothetical protein
MDPVYLWNGVWWVGLYIHVLLSWVVTLYSTDRPEDRGRGSSMCTVLHDVTAQNTSFRFLLHFLCRFCTYWCCPLKEPCLLTRVCGKLWPACSGFVSSPDWQVSRRSVLSPWWEIYMFLFHLTIFAICLEYENWLPYSVTSQVWCRLELPAVFKAAASVCGRVPQGHSEAAVLPATAVLRGSANSRQHSGTWQGTLKAVWSVQAWVILLFLRFSMK